MTQVLIEITLILVLLVANGVFVMTEIAVVSARRGRLQALEEAGNPATLRGVYLSSRHSFPFIRVHVSTAVNLGENRHARLEIMDMDGHRVDKVLIHPVVQSPGGAQNE